MTATDELRALLDERGVEWDYGLHSGRTTEFCSNGVWLCFADMRDGIICTTILTPAKAIAATLGRGTCRIKDGDIIEVNGVHTVYECSECGEQFWAMTFSPSYCPRCGRKAVDG